MQICNWERSDLQQKLVNFWCAKRSKKLKDKYEGHNLGRCIAVSKSEGRGTAKGELVTPKGISASPELFEGYVLQKHRAETM